MGHEGNWKFKYVRLAILATALATAAFGLAPTRVAAQYPEQCAAERGLYSQQTSARANIVIVNQAPYPVRVYWINFNGARVPYKILSRGQNFRTYSYVSHPWVVTDMAGNCRQVFFVENDDRTYIFNAPESRRPYEPRPYDPRPYDPGPYQPRPYDGPDTIEPLTERDAYREIDVPVGQELTIALPSNASTGYHWDATFPTNISLLGDVTEERSSNAMIGQGGTSLVRFRVVRPGAASITLMYLPPGGGRAQKMLTYRFRGV